MDEKKQYEEPELEIIEILGDPGTDSNATPFDPFD